MDSANAMPAGAQATPQSPKEKKWGKWVVVILVILAILLISGIIIVTLTGMGIIDFGDKKGQTAETTDIEGEDDADKQEVLQNKVDSTKEKDANLESEIAQYVREAEAEYGEDSVETARAKVLYADYYLGVGSQKAGERYLQSEITRLTGGNDDEDGIQMTEDQQEIYIIYMMRLLNYYASIDEYEKVLDMANMLLNNIPDDATMHYENWPAIKDELVMIKKKYANMEEG